jgi:ribosomal protein S18 acetylase RimI-like enzyme
MTMTAEMTSPVEYLAIGSMEPHELPAVLDVLARALRDNPMNVGMFGPEPARRFRSVRILYRMILSSLDDPPLVARTGSRIVGVAATAPPETCFFYRSRARRFRIKIGGREMTVESPAMPWRELPAMLRLGFPALNRAGLMGQCSAVHDPAGRHWHVELVGVEPDLQGRGIGGKLMGAVLRHTDAAGEPAHQETDTPENVRFYGRLGFDVVAQEEPLGVMTWYMTRPAASQER